jgi:hypothetical protein
LTRAFAFSVFVIVGSGCTKPRSISGDASTEMPKAVTEEDHQDAVDETDLSDTLRNLSRCPIVVAERIAKSTCIADFIDRCGLTHKPFVTVVYAPIGQMLTSRLKDSCKFTTGIRPKPMIWI